jgi:hypothetical protein
MSARAGRASLRYQSLDPVREAIGDAHTTGERHAALALATHAIETIFLSIEPEPMQGLVVARLDVAEDEHENLRFLISERLRTEPRRALDLAIAGSRFWPVRGGGVQGRQWLEQATATVRPEGDLAWDALLALTRTIRHFGEIARLRPELEQAVAEMRTAGRDDLTYVHLVGYLASARGWTGDGEGATALLDEAQRIVDGFGSEWAQAQLGKVRALGLAMNGDLAGARHAQRDFARRLLALGDEINAENSFYLAAALGDMAGHDDVMDDIRVAQEMATELRDIPQLGQLLLLQARAVRRSGEARGRELLAEAADRLVELGGIRAAALARRDLGLLQVELGDNFAARSELARALPALLQLDRPAAALAVAGIAVLSARSGDADRAQRLASAALALRGTHAPQSAEDAAQLDQLVGSLGPLEQTDPLDDVTLMDVAGVT